MSEIFLPFLAVAVLVALSDWRYGLHAAVITAIGQDALRKITPSQPIYFLLLVGVVFAAACASAYFSGVPATPNRVFGWRRFLARPFAFFLIVLAAQSLQSIARFGSPIVPAIGLLTYLAPIPAVVFGYQFAVRCGPKRVEQFLTFYLICATLALGTVYLEFLGVDWSILGEVGEGLRIYDVGTVLSAHSGVFRSSEVAAWHTATCVCFLLLLVTYRRTSLTSLVFAALVVAFLLGVGVLTGRRKLFIEVAVFCAAYVGLLALFRRGAVRLAIAIGLAGIIVFGALVFGVAPDTGNAGDAPVTEQASQYDLYVQRSGTVFGDVPERFQHLGLTPVMWAYVRVGLFGAGLGAGSQGAQYFSSGTQAVAGGAAEGGIGKVMLELGVPGLLVILWFAASLARVLWHAMRYTAQMSPHLARLAFGLFGFLAANVAAFTVATQVYADIFILLTLGISLGFLLATPVMAQRIAQTTRARPVRYGPVVGAPVRVR